MTSSGMDRVLRSSHSQRALRKVAIGLFVNAGLQHQTHDGAVRIRFQRVGNHVVRQIDLAADQPDRRVQAGLFEQGAQDRVEGQLAIGDLYTGLMPRIVHAVQFDTAVPLSAFNGACEPDQVTAFQGRFQRQAGSADNWSPECPSAFPGIPRPSWRGAQSRRALRLPCWQRSAAPACP